MRITRFIDEQGRTQRGIDQGNGFALVSPDGSLESAASNGVACKIARRLAPIEPVNILCIGANYREHCLESNAPIPELPVLFMKPTSALNHPGANIVLPACCKEEVDYECELAVVIGKAARDVKKEDALQYVFGYTAANDISARLWQKNAGGGQWIRGKGFDSFCPLGPVLVTADEIPDPQTLRLSTTLNGKVMQNHTTGDMIFNVAYLISYLSRDMTLLPGTVILTGTPQGVGFARKPAVFLQHGDKLVVEIEKIGKLENQVMAAGRS